MTSLDGLLLQYAEDDDAPELSIMQLVTVLTETTERDELLTGLLDTAVDQALALAAQDRADAERRLVTTSLLAVGLLVASVIGALALGRSVSRSLRVLSGQATQVSEGSLVAVEAGGPREVRTVSAAL